MTRRFTGTCRALLCGALLLGVVNLDVRFPGASTLVAQDASAPPTGAGASDSTSPAPAAPSLVAAAGAELQTVGGSVRGAIRSLSYDPATGIIKLDDAAAKLEDTVLMRLPKQAAKRGEVELLLRGGEQVFVSLLEGDESSIRCTSDVLVSGTDIDSPLEVSIDDLRALVLPGQFPTAASYVHFKQSLPGGSRAPIAVGAAAPAPKSDDDEDDDADVVTTLEGSRLGGVVNSIGASGLDFEAGRLGEIKLQLSKIRALTIADLGDDEPEESESAVQVAATLQDDSYIIGPLLELGPGGLRVRSATLGDVRVRLDDLRFLEVRGGRSVFLSDLDPDNVRHKDDLLEPRPVRRDANVLGAPIRIRDQVFRKGLGMLSHVRLDYELGGKYTRFRAVIGMDDAARPTTLAAASSGGVALFRVHVDDRVVLEKELSYRDAAYPVDVALESMTDGVKRNAERLSIEVDYGAGFLVLDYANWADARLIRE